MKKEATFFALLLGYIALIAVLFIVIGLLF